MLKKKKSEKINNVESDETEVSSRDGLMRILTNSIDDVFLVLGEKFDVEYVSPNIDRVLGIAAKEVEKKIDCLGKAAYIDDKEVTYKTLKEMQIGGSFSLVCGRDHKRTHDHRFFRETVYCVEGSDGARKYVVLIADCTNELIAKQSLEEALTIAKIANQSKTTFLANMSHDIRTPMNTIVGLCTLLQRDIDDAEKLQEHVKHIILTSRHMLTLINDILDMSKIESGDTALKESEISVSELVKEVTAKVALQAKAKRQTFNTVVAIRDEKFLGDKLRIKRVLNNVLSNAVQYTPDGGRIEFKVQQMARPSLKYMYLQFIVKDNGVGMSPEFVKKIFEPFTRELRGVADVQGTGLGMAIAKNLVDLMGGTITVDSKENVGSTFVVSFKFPYSKANDAEFWIEQGISRVLVVGGNNVDNNSITWAMRKSGVNISFAKNMKAAYASLEKANQEGKGPHIVLCDWYGEEEENLQAIKDIRSQLSEYTPLVALGDCEWSEVENKATEAGVDAFLPKPFLLAAFKECIINLKVAGREGVPVVEKKPSALENMRFLAAEDNELNAMVLVELLKMAGASCIVKTNGQECLDEFVNSREGYYDGVLMDIQMPVMDGYEATTAIRESEHPQAKSIPIIAMTANAFAEDVQKSMDAGMNAHLLKPIDMHKFEEIIVSIKNGDEQ